MIWYWKILNSSKYTPEPKAHRWAYSIPWSVVCPQCLNILLSETAVQIKAKFYVEPPWVGGMKFCSQHLGHLTKMATTTIYGKNPSKISETGTNFHETWYVASGTPAHHSLFKWWPWVDLDLFYGKVKFGNLGFSIGKIEKSGFFRNHWSLWPESW